MDNDGHYESLLVLGSEMEDRKFSNHKIRLAIYPEMYRLYNGQGGLPYCIIREIRDAYPPEL